MRTIVSIESSMGSPASPFEDALKDFKKALSRRDQEKFKNVTLDDLKQNIGEIQATQQASRRMRDLTRLQPFLEAVEQFGKVIETFCNVHEIVAFVWVSGTSGSI
jgi:hypothetical protein